MNQSCFIQKQTHTAQKESSADMVQSYTSQRKSMPASKFLKPNQPNMFQKKEETQQEKHELSNEPMKMHVNNTGLPNQLKSGIENMSGYSLDNVRVHYNSSKPAQLQALAYTQGTDIHVAPGQEKHLGHEAWHVVQQMQGRVHPTMQMKGVNINDNSSLEHEADVMGEKALISNYLYQLKKQYNCKSSIIQRTDNPAQATIDDPYVIPTNGEGRATDKSGICKFPLAFKGLCLFRCDTRDLTNQTILDSNKDDALQAGVYSKIKGMSDKELGSYSQAWKQPDTNTHPMVTLDSGEQKDSIKPNGQYFNGLSTYPDAGTDLGSTTKKREYKVDLSNITFSLVRKTSGVSAVAFYSGGGIELQILKSGMSSCEIDIMSPVPANLITVM